MTKNCKNKCPECGLIGQPETSTGLVYKTICTKSTKQFRPTDTVCRWSSKSGRKIEARAEETNALFFDG